ncbi:MAG: TRM11 family SAM-dependent methyltransferase [Thermoplasmata archaeon]|jgi:DNA modification methylase
MKINDLDLRRWKEYDEILTDSLWIFERRERGFTRTGEYHGNFIPQIPRQAMLRFTRKNEWVLDPFAGLGTTLIEARILGRNSIGIELVEDNVRKIREILSRTPGEGIQEVVQGDSMDPEVFRMYDRRYQLAILHPPYWKAIRFSDDPRDMSNLPDLNSFLGGFSRVLDNTLGVLDGGRYLVLVIGDIYDDGEIIPLGFLTMDIVLKKGLKLKGIVVKNIEENRGKRNKRSLWRYRALKNGLYVFKHEYIFFFQK